MAKYYFERRDYSGTYKPQSSTDHPTNGKTKLTASKITNVLAKPNPNYIDYRS